MKNILLILLILISNLTLGQDQITEFDAEFRRLSGQIVDADGEPLLGQNVIIKGTNITTITNFEGNFCFVIPKNKLVFIELLFCFDQIVRKVGPTENDIEIKIIKEKRKTRKALRKYEKVKVELNAELQQIFNSEEYKNAKNICG